MNYTKYNKARLNNILWGLFPTFLSFFTKRDRSFIVCNSTLNMKFDGNTKEFFLYLLNNTNYNVVYVINDDEFRYKLIEQYGNFFIETNSFKGKMNALKAKTWFLNCFELPVGGVFLKWRRNVICLQHGVPIKTAGLTEKDVTFLKRVYYKIIKTNVSHILITSKLFVDFTRKYTNIKEKNILISGFPRFDLVSNKINNPKYERKIKILYAPTWRHFANVRLFPFDDLDLKQLDNFCESKNIEIYIRMHPGFGDGLSENLYSYKRIKEFSSDIEPDINSSLYKFDMLITDYSSIFYDFYLLDRPIFFFDYDREEYEKNVGFAVDYDIYAVGYRTHTMKEFFANLEDALTNDRYKSEREHICKICNGESMNNSKDLFDLLCKKGVLEK